MAKQLGCSGLGDLQSLLEENKGKQIYVLFTGSLDKTGKSWCPDCVNADPVIEKNICKLPEDAVFILCEVGTREAWKNPANEFRTNPDVKLTSVPTLLKYGTPKRLVESDCAKSDMVAMLFEDD